jgi:hypothetical protein
MYRLAQNKGILGRLVGLQSRFTGTDVHYGVVNETESTVLFLDVISDLDQIIVLASQRGYIGRQHWQAKVQYLCQVGGSVQVFHIWPLVRYFLCLGELTPEQRRRDLDIALFWFPFVDHGVFGLSRFCKRMALMSVRNASMT